MAFSVNEINIIGERVQDLFHATYSEYLSGQKNNFVDLARESRTKDKALNYEWYYDWISEYEEQGNQTSPKYETVLGDYVRIPLKRFKKGLRLSVVDVETDKINKLFQESAELAKIAAWFNRDECVRIISNGAAAPYIAYDGQPLYSATHSNNGNTYNNLMAGAISDVTLAAAWTRMTRFPNSVPSNPKPMGLQPDVIIVPPDLKFTAMQFLHNAQFPVATFNTENVYKDLMEVRVEPTLTDTNDWYVMCKSAKVSPFVHGKHEKLGEVELVPEISPDSPSVRDHDEYRWTAKFMQAIWFTHPFLQIKFVN